MNKVIIIGIAGASASGKTLLAKTIVDEIGSRQVSIIAEDCYYKDLSHLTIEQRAVSNFDHPDSLDHALLKQHLLDLHQGKTINIPQYDHANHLRKTETKSIGNKSIIILEGILLLAEPMLRDQLDIKIFVDAPMDICLLRRLKRDLNERGRSIKSVLSQYQKTVKPMYLQFIEPSKRYADIIIPRGGKNRIAIDLIKTRIKELLGENGRSE